MPSFKLCIFSFNALENESKHRGNAHYQKHGDECVDS